MRRYTRKSSSHSRDYYIKTRMKVACKEIMNKLNFDKPLVHRSHVS